MKSILLLLVVLSTLSATAQRTVPPTNSLRIQGKIKKEKTFTLAELDTFFKVALPNQIIYNHKGEVKDTLTKIKGIPFKTLFAPIEFIYDKPKVLNEFYFVFFASDGYKVVFSWNEIYNTETGNNFYIVTEMEGKKLQDLEQRIIFLSTADLKTGRRYIRGLERIEVRKVE